MADETKTSADGSSYFENTRWTMRELHRAAKAAHEMNRRYCELHGDHSQLPWESAPGWAQESAVAGVQALALDPGMSPEESHESWAAVKRADGWTYGPTKDTERREHPCLVPYRELPVLQRVKDAFFGITVRASLGIEFETLFHVLVNDTSGKNGEDDDPTDPGRKTPGPGQIGQ